MKSELARIILNEMETLESNFQNCRACFPSMDDTYIGEADLTTRPYNMARGFHIRFHFNQPLSGQHIKRFRELNTWMNQNVIVRLYALLEFYHIVSKKAEIDWSINGCKELDFLRRLRNVFAHTSGKYIAENQDHRTLRQELVSHFRIGIVFPDEFPLPVDTVIKPLFQGCKDYVEGKCAKQSSLEIDVTAEEVYQCQEESVCS